MLGIVMFISIPHKYSVGIAIIAPPIRYPIMYIIIKAKANLSDDLISEIKYLKKP